MAHVRAVSTASSIYLTDQASSDQSDQSDAESQDEFVEASETTPVMTDLSSFNNSPITNRSSLGTRSESPQILPLQAPKYEPSENILEKLSHGNKSRASPRLTSHSYKFSTASSNTFESTKSFPDTLGSEFEQSSPSLSNPSFEESRKESYYLPPQYEKPNAIVDSGRPSTSKSKRHSLFRSKTPDQRPKSSSSRRSLFRSKTPDGKESQNAVDGSRPRSRSTSRQSFFRSTMPDEMESQEAVDGSRPRSRSTSRQSFFRPKTPTKEMPVNAKSTRSPPNKNQSSIPMIKSDSRHSFRSRIPKKSPGANSSANSPNWPSTPTSASPSPSRPQTASTIKSRSASRIPISPTSSVGSRIRFPAAAVKPNEISSRPATPRSRLSSLSKTVQDALTLRRRSRSAGNLKTSNPWNNENVPPLPSSIPVIASRTKQSPTLNAKLSSKSSIPTLRERKTRPRSSTNPSAPVPHSWELEDAPPLPLPASVRLMHPVIPPRSSSRQSETGVVSSIMSTLSEAGSFEQQASGRVSAASYRPGTLSAASQRKEAAVTASHKQDNATASSRQRTKSDWEISDEITHHVYGDQSDFVPSTNGRQSVLRSATNYPDDDGDIDDNIPESPDDKIKKPRIAGMPLRSSMKPSTKRVGSPMYKTKALQHEQPKFATRDSFSKFIDDPNTPTLLVSPNSMKRSSRPPRISVPVVSEDEFDYEDDYDMNGLGIYRQREILLENQESSRKVDSRASNLNARSSSEESSRSTGARSRPRTPISPINLAMFRRKGSDDVSPRLPKHKKSASSVFRTLNRRTTTPTRDEIQMFGTDESGEPYFVKKVGQGYSSPTIPSFPVDQLRPKSPQRNWLSSISSNVPSIPNVTGRKTPTSMTALTGKVSPTYPHEVLKANLPLTVTDAMSNKPTVHEELKSVFEDNSPSDSDSASIYSSERNEKINQDEADAEAESDASSVDSFMTALDHLSRPVSMVIAQTSDSIMPNDLAISLGTALENEQERHNAASPISTEEASLSVRSTPSSEGIMSRTRPTSATNVANRPFYTPPMTYIPPKASNHGPSHSLSDFNKMLAEMESQTVEKLKVEAFRVATTSQENHIKTITPKTSSSFLKHDPHESPRPSTSGSRKSFWRSTSPSRSLRNSFSSRRKSTSSRKSHSRPTTNNFGGVEFIAPRGSPLSAEESQEDVDDDDGYHDEEKALGARDLWGGGHERKNSSEMYLDRFVAYGFT